MWYGIYAWGPDATGNMVQGNIIGLDATATNPVPNATDTNSPRGGILLSNTTDFLVGGTGAGEGNIVSGNAEFGVIVNGASAAGNAILGNQISGNADLGIDLGGDGITINDGGDVDAGPNGLLNFPVITSAVETAGTVTVDVDLDVPAGDYRIEFFANPSAADPSGYGEGETFVHAESITHTGTGIESFSTAFVGSLGQALTATTTEDLGGGSYGGTSEFSAAATVIPLGFDVNSTGDAGDATPGDGLCRTGGTNSDGDPECTLRAAIEEINSAGGDGTTVSFAIPTTDPGY